MTYDADSDDWVVHEMPSSRRSKLLEMLFPWGETSEPVRNDVVRIQRVFRGHVDRQRARRFFSQRASKRDAMNKWKIVLGIRHATRHLCARIVQTKYREYAKNRGAILHRVRARLRRSEEEVSRLHGKMESISEKRRRKRRKARSEHRQLLEETEVSFPCNE